MLPRVVCVYWGFHSWWCSPQRGGLHGLLNLAISPERMPLTYGCHHPPVCVSACVTPKTFQFMHDCGAQQPRFPPQSLCARVCVCMCLCVRACGCGCVCASREGGGDPSVLDTTLPPTNCWPEAPWGGCGRRGSRRGEWGGSRRGLAGGGGVLEGRLGGGGPGGANWGGGGDPSGAIWGVWGGGDPLPPVALPLTIPSP